VKRGITTAVVVIFAGAGVSPAEWKADIGYTSLKTRLGPATPTGAGIDVTQTEATSGGAYFPDTGNAEFAGKAHTVTGFSRA
jgi:hypothetical protein